MALLVNRYSGPVGFNTLPRLPATIAATCDHSAAARHRWELCVCTHTPHRECDPFRQKDLLCQRLIRGLWHAYHQQEALSESNAE
ncbi:MAG: hypothetical protein KIS67_03455 [Verrucomicrobiae bacterium]|nr:hypothetical protein [Verrucomicrobiae bacterium]